MHMRKLIIGLVIIILSLGIIAGGLFLWYKSGGLQKEIITVVGNSINSKIGYGITSSTAGTNVLQEVLGYSQPRTYLLLFLNNTELRPGGGFIGAYAVVRIDKGSPQILKVEGTEILDNYAPQDALLDPPAPLKKYLLISKWAFRDSNWSPDFASSSVQSLEMFKLENGTAAGQIDAVIGFTPTVLEGILKISGPITVDGEQFTADNFTDKMEYEVEYGYYQRGLPPSQRKQVLADLAKALMAKLKTDIMGNWGKYLALGQNMLAQKQIAAYSSYSQAEQVLVAKGWAGEMKQTAGDYILWADANLGALKTDKVVVRNLSYSFSPTSSPAGQAGNIIADLKMDYKNTGNYGKFTTVYRDYARIYVPIGSRFISVSGSSKDIGAPGTVDQGIENGRQWFGTFIAINPGETGELEWHFYLAPGIVSQIQNKTYSLLVQKQIGTIGNGLTLSLDFGKDILLSAYPGESSAQYGDSRYSYNTDLSIDRQFDVKLK